MARVCGAVRQDMGWVAQDKVMDVLSCILLTSIRKDTKDRTCEGWITFNLIYRHENAETRRCRTIERDRQRSTERQNHREKELQSGGANNLCNEDSEEGRNV